jgi:hypothetical protein
MVALVQQALYQKNDDCKNQQQALQMLLE